MKLEIITAEERVIKANNIVKDLELEIVEKGNKIMMLTAQAEEGQKGYTALMNRKLELEDILEGREETIEDLRTKLREAN